MPFTKKKFILIVFTIIKLKSDVNLEKTINLGFRFNFIRLLSGRFITKV